MKNTILFFFLLLAAAVSAQSNSFVTDRLRAAEYFRIGTNTSQKVTGFDRVITAPGTHDSLPTSRAVVDFLEANFTPIGYYTAGTGISISDDVITNTAPDQVVGLTGAGITVITGTYPNFTITSNEVDGSVTNELQNLSLSGQSLGISSGTGVTLPVVGVTAGTGIGVSSSSGNFTVSNTGDLSATNELQTLSISGNELTLSDGGGTVTLPGGADGNGIYSGSGTVPFGTVVTLAGDFEIDNQGAAAIKMGDTQGVGKGIGMNVSDTYFQFGNPFGAGTYSVTSSFDGPSSDWFVSIVGNNDELKFGQNGAVYIDAGDGLGIQYNSEYPDILTNDRSIPDVGLTKQIVASENGALGTGFTGGGGNGTIPDGTIAAVGTNSMRFGDISTFLTDIGSAIGTYSTPQNFELTGYNDGADGQFGHFFSGKLDDYEAKITYDAYGLKAEASPDNNSTINALYVTGDGISITSADGLGVQYTAEYPDILTNDRSIPDVGLTKQLISSENGALGTGFTGGGGSGVIPESVATLSGHFGIENAGSNIDLGDLDNSAYGLKLHIDDIEMRFGNNDFNYILSPENEYQLFTSPSSQIEQSISYTNINLNAGSFLFVDNRASTVGVEYAADYSTTIKSNDRSVPDVGTVNILKQTPVSYTNAAAPNNTIFYSTTDSKLSYKDPGGTVHGLY